MDGLPALRVILGFSLLSTTLHYAHNSIALDQYPSVDGLGGVLGQVLIVFAWLLFTAFGVLGYRRYARKADWTSLAFLAVYSLAGLATMGHFLVGPVNLPAFWFATIFTDTLAGLAIWVFVIWAATRNAAVRGEVSTQH
ncbi:hypothetical protein SAMN05421504_102255 [Amycolatopsis xylanica]|uniref:Uncharacterized protein n=1 Tax=Amycolatopsis xylanica TaxID=589385 RepID=A0A1H2YT43_9PSEU|nr:hypothetical protein [Amycolatopsis xylanica]SDX08352.1 hypothetical protein SAMN05421504_102255 [Amycolatopsis xylanica]